MESGRMVMKVIGFNGSPRKNGNTATLVNSILKGAESRGASVRLVNLHELKMKGCLDCEECKKDLHRCVQKDDLSPILRELGEYDAIVLGTPVYWWHVNPPLKLLTDRFYCFFSEEVNPETGEVKYGTAFPQGRKFVVVTSRGDEEDAKLFPELYGYLTEWLKMLTAVMGASSTEFINHCGSLTDRNSARNNADLVARAESIGASLA
jgi:multimeric flavodoxin WrbA